MIKKYLKTVIVQLIDATEQLIKYYKGQDKTTHLNLLQLRDKLMSISEWI